MRIFVLLDTPFPLPGLLQYQCLHQMVEATRNLDQYRFCFVSNKEIPAPIQQIEASHVECMTEKEAQIKFHSVINGVVLHFGKSIKGAHIFPNYFIPLYHPSEDRSLGMIAKWKFKKIYADAIKKSTATLCLNDWIYQVLLKNHPDKEVNLSLTHLPTAPTIVYYWSIIAHTKDEFAGGNNYFMGLVDVDQTIAIAKEFSIFKKWQLTNMTLVLLYHNNEALSQASALLKGFKYKSDVFMYTYDQITEELLAGAYAIFCQTSFVGNSLFVDLALQHQVPLMFDTNLGLPISWERAGEQFDFKELQGLSNHFKLYYKDEQFRQARTKIGSEWLVEIDKIKAREYPKKLPLSL